MFSFAAFAQEKVADGVEFDRTVYNFGDVMLSDGPLSCSFTIKNTGSKPIAVYSVISSCGCTGVEWTREPLQPGRTGTIKATYSNDEGPYPFDKTLSVYVPTSSKPILLRIRGIAHEKKLSLEESFPERLGPLGVKELEYKAGNMEQGRVRSDEFEIANLSKKAVRLEFHNVTPELTLSVSPNPIPAGKVATVKYTVAASREKWGTNYYYATPFVGGVEYAPIAVWAITKENFSNLTKEEKDKGSRPMFTTSTYSFGKVRKGKKVEATFTFSNSGKSDFVVYKVDSDFAGAKLRGAIPTVKPGAKCTFTVDLDTSELPAGEALVIVRLITNSPVRPLVDLFLTGWITE